MIAPWMLWAALLGGLTLLAAHAAEYGLRALRRPVRGVWLLAIVITVLIPAWRAVRRMPAPPTAAESIVMPLPAASLSVAVLSTSAASLNRASILNRKTLDALLLTLWALATAGLGSRLLLSLRRLHRKRAEWSTTLLDDVPVLVSAGDGPAVTGMVRPVIVIPAWLQQQTPAERRLILWHEQEHCLARDPALLAAASLLVALMPWNPALWLMRRRLRLAIELDCDARVLVRGTDAASYGSLLLAVAERKAWAAGPALLETPSFLERRIRAMTRVPIRHPVAHVGLAALLATVPVLLAGSVPQPVPLLPSREAVAAPIDTDQAEVVASIPASQRPQEPPTPAPSRSRRPMARPPVPPPSERDSAAPAQNPQQDPIPLERLKSLVALNYPEAARNGSGAEAVWILMDTTRSRIMFETMRAPVPEPLTPASMAQVLRIVGEANLLEPWRTTYLVAGPGSPAVDVVVARVRPGVVRVNSFATPAQRTPRADSANAWFEALNAVLRRQMRLLYDDSTTGEIHGWFLVTPDLRVIRAERDRRADAARSWPEEMTAAAASYHHPAPGPYMRNGAVGWAPGQVYAGKAGAYFIVVGEP